MKQNFMVYADSTSDLSPDEFIGLRDKLFSEIARRIPRSVEIDEACLLVRNLTAKDLEMLSDAACVAGIDFNAVMDDCYTEIELCNARFVRLGIEGEPVDMDENGDSLNIFPEVLCDSCNMPNEWCLPNPYRVSESFHQNVESDYWGEGTLSREREIFPAHFGVMVVTDRVKSLLERVVPGSIISVPISTGMGGECQSIYWAVRPVANWGIQEKRCVENTCETCNSALEARLGEEPETRIIDSRLRFEGAEIPDAEICCVEGWFGDRSVVGSGIIRDVLVSGRLYSVLVKNRIRGICNPSEPVWIGNTLPSFEENDVKQWIARVAT